MRQTIIETAFQQVDKATAMQIAKICGTTQGSARQAVNLAKRAKMIVVVGREARKGRHGQPGLIYAMNPEHVAKKKPRAVDRPAFGRNPPKERTAVATANIVGMAIASRTALEAAWAAR